MSELGLRFGGWNQLSVAGVLSNPLGEREREKREKERERIREEKRNGKERDRDREKKETTAKENRRGPTHLLLFYRSLSPSTMLVHLTYHLLAHVIVTSDFSPRLSHLSVLYTLVRTVLCHWHSLWSTSVYLSPSSSEGRSHSLTLLAWFTWVPAAENISFSIFDHLISSLGIPRNVPMNKGYYL